MRRVLRAVQVDGDVAYVPLNGGAVSVIDAADAELVGRCNWFRQVSGSGHEYAMRNCRTGTGTLMHRLILQPPKGVMIDHADGDGLNNRRSNLRLCTRSQNACNSRLRLSSNTGLKGVQLPKNGRFYVVIKVNKKAISLGGYATAEEAQAVYAAAAAKYHGEFARLA